jgi:hypothetical protein
MGYNIITVKRGAKLMKFKVVNNSGEVVGTANSWDMAQEIARLAIPEITRFMWNHHIPGKEAVVTETGLKPYSVTARVVARIVLGD